MRLTYQSKVRENLLPAGKDKGPEGERGEERYPHIHL